MELISNELRSVIAAPAGDSGPVFSGLAEERLEARVAKIEARERAVDEAEERLGGWATRLGAQERDLRTLERQIRAKALQAARSAEAVNRVGRNERCPCNSGLKYKHCHGLPGRHGNTNPR